MTPSRIYEEWLYRFRKTTEPTMLFERSTASDGRTSVSFGRIKLDNGEDADFLSFVARGTRANQLFLTESLEKNIVLFQDIYHWFAEKLTIIFPESRYLGLGVGGRELQFGDSLLEYLIRFDTGINGIILETVEPEKELPREIIDEVLKRSQEGTAAVRIMGPQERFFIEVSDDGEMTARKLMLKHKMRGSNNEIAFEMKEESDGTQRLLDLIPLLLLAQHNRVFVIDELERSLHPNLSRKFIELFLQAENHSQLIITTHESALLDLDLLRRDEVWFIEKDRSGASSVYSLEEYKPRYDKDIEKGYLLGRFGAIPVIDHISLS